LLQAISKPKLLPNCHSEQTEESHLFSELRSFTFVQDDKKTGFEVACKKLPAVVEKSQGAPARTLAPVMDLPWGQKQV